MSFRLDNIDSLQRIVQFVGVVVAT